MDASALTAALDHLEVKRMAFGMPAPPLGVEPPEVAEFARAESVLSCGVPEQVREWFRWRNGIPFSTGVRYANRLLVRPWEHLSLGEAVEMLEMLLDIHEEEGLPSHELDGWFPLLMADSMFVMVDVTDPELRVKRYDEGELFELDEGATLLTFVEGLARSLE